MGQCNRWFRLTSARNLAQQQVLAVGTRLSQDLRQSVYGAVSAVAAPDNLVLAFPTCYDAKREYQVTPFTQQPHFQTYEVFFRNSPDQTLRVLRSALGETFPTAEPVAPTLTLPSATSGDSQVLARFIKSFSLVGGVDNPLSVKLIVETAVEGSQEKKLLEVTSTIRIPR